MHLKNLRIRGGLILGKENINIKYEEISKYLVIAIFIMFVVFTFFPPRIDIFKDEVTSTYGVFEFK